MAYHGSRDSNRRQPQSNYPSNYPNPSQYSIPDSVYSDHSTNVQQVPSPGGYHQQPSPTARAINPTYYQPQPTASSMTSHDMLYGRPSPSPNEYGTSPGDVFRGPDPTMAPSHQTPYKPYPDQSYSFSTDYSDENKPFASTTHLVSPQKEWDIGSVMPVTTMPTINHLPYQPYQAYPPQPSPSPTTPRGGTSHWHAMRKQLLERRVIKQVPLHNGNLVMDVPVPKGAIPSTKGLGVIDGEMDSMRYTAATCDPDDFMRNKFSLRQYLYGRKTELFVIDPRVLKVLQLMGVYYHVVDKETQAHIFEYTSQVVVSQTGEVGFGSTPIQLLFCLKEYEAVANHADGTGPLAAYFRGELMNQPGATATIFDRNKFLAEDRILAFEIVVKKNARWRLHYVKAAKAGTDVPATVPEFISQRRRWLNGSIFAATYAMVCFWRIWTSGHVSIKVTNRGLTGLDLVNLLFNWLSVSSFYLAFFFLISSSISGSSDPFNGAGDEIFQAFNKVYIALIFVVLTVPHTSEGWIDVSALLENKTFVQLALSLMATYGLYLISSLLYFEPWHMLTSFVQYLLLLPSYVNILLIYAMCNLHDVSWGTKGDNGSSKDLGAARKVKKDGKEMAEVALPTKQEDVEALWQQARQELRVPVKEKAEKRSAETKRADEDRNFRTNVVLLFLGSNMLIILLFTSSTFTNWVNSHFVFATSSTFNPYLTVIFYVVLALSALRFTGCVLYLAFRMFGY
ncbi:uncharacterized protein IAS62_002825 [Cryptococcus decagattii]|uniref:Chitin synthase n=1 Tax=Cryptococcus decagattii TaxID=1859122 RepID=A0ABZ2AVY5_9TREE